MPERIDEDAGMIVEGDEDASCLGMLPVENCLEVLNGGEDAASFLNSFLIASDDIDEAGVSGGGPLLVLLEDCFFDLEPIFSEDESWFFWATCCLHFARRFLNHTCKFIEMYYYVFVNSEDPFLTSN